MTFEHCNVFKKNSIENIILIAAEGIKCAATFAALALAVCAGCGVCAMASGGGCAAAVGTLAAVVGCNAAMGVRRALMFGRKSKNETAD